MSLLASATNSMQLNAKTLAYIGGNVGLTTSSTAQIHSAGLPAASAVTSHLSGDPNVTAAYNPPDGNHTPLALIALELDSDFIPGSTPTFSATADYSFDVGMLTGGNLLVGLLDPTSSGPGFTSLHFTIEREGATVEDQTFATLAAAMSYFNDHVLDLGSMATGVVGTLDLSLTLGNDLAHQRHRVRRRRCYCRCRSADLAR